MNQEQNNFNTQNNNFNPSMGQNMNINQPVYSQQPQQFQNQQPLEPQMNQVYQQQPIYNQPNINNTQQEPKKNNKKIIIIIIAVVLALIAVISGILIFTKEDKKEPVNNNDNVVDKEDNESEEINDIISTEPKYRSELLDSKYFSNENFTPYDDSLGYDDIQGRIIDISPGLVLTKQKLYYRTDRGSFDDKKQIVNGYTKIEREEGDCWNAIKNDKNEYKIFYNWEKTLELDSTEIYTLGSNKNVLAIHISIIQKEDEGFNIINYGPEYDETKLKNLKKEDTRPLELYSNGQILNGDIWKIKDYVAVPNCESCAIIILKNNDSYIVKEQIDYAYHNKGVYLASEKITNVDKFFETKSINLITYSEINVIDKIFINYYNSENNKYLLTGKKSVLLPDGYTTKDIKNIENREQLYGTKFKFIIEFNDNNIYVLNENNSFELLEELSNLNKENHMVKIIINENNDAVLMDDGYLYKINK